MAALAIESTTPRGATWTGRVLAGIGAGFMTFAAVLHLAKPAAVTQAFAQLGFPESQSVTIGALALVSVIVYLTPRTAVLGAVVLTGYLGGAIAIQLRVGASTFSVLFPVIIAALLWGGLALRDRPVIRMVR